MDKLQSELSSQRDKLEDVTRMQSRLKEWKARNESVMEAKAMLEDQLEDLQGKVDLLDVVQKENAQLKAQMDSINMVGTMVALYMYLTMVYSLVISYTV